MNDRAHAESWGPEAAGALYEHGRPGYPVTAGPVLRAGLGLGPGSRVADIAAGTGKLTRLLTEVSDGEVLAVEPMPGMRAQLRTVCPDARAVAGTAEHLPFASGTLDAVTVAQAFHWLRLPDAAIELARVLRPGGRLAIVTNRVRHTEPWQEELWAILRRYEAIRPRPGSVTTWRDELSAAGRFDAATRTELPHEQQFASLADLDARMGSISHVLLLRPPDRAAMFDEMHAAVGSDRPILLTLQTIIEIATVAPPP